MKKFQKIIVIFAVMFSFAYAGSAMNSEEFVVLINSNETMPVIENAGFINEATVFLKVDCYDVFTVCDNHAPDDYGHFMDCMESNGC